MYRGVVVEVKEKYSIILTDGQFCRICNKGDMQKGQTVIYTEEDIYIKKPVSMNQKIYAIAGMAASFLLVFTLAYMMNFSKDDIYTVATVDINPRLELLLNKADKVNKITALNDDGKKLGKLNLEGLSIEDAVELIVQRCQEEGFIDESGESFVVVTTIPIKEKARNKNIEIKSKLAQKSKKSVILQSVNVATIEATKEEYNQAKKLSIPAGIYSLKKAVDINKYNSVKKFFKEQDNIKVFMKKGDIIISPKKEKQDMKNNQNHDKKDKTGKTEKIKKIEQPVNKENKEKVRAGGDKTIPDKNLNKDINNKIEEQSAEENNKNSKEIKKVENKKGKEVKEKVEDRKTEENNETEVREQKVSDKKITGEE